MEINECIKGDISPCMPDLCPICKACWESGKCHQNERADESDLERIVSCAGDKAQEPERICPSCGHYPLVLTGSKGGGYRLAYCDKCIYEEEF